jgi:glycerophosphoryl diester phosphodiesterase
MTLWRAALVTALWVTAARPAVGVWDDASCPDTSVAGPTIRTERPAWLVNRLPGGVLRERLEQCLGEPADRGARTIGHRGAALRYPEHTRESYTAAARLGAAILECDVTATRDDALVCRHDACDLHRTTNILATPLAGRCRTPFRPADLREGNAAEARCCTADFDLAELKLLRGRRDAVNPRADNVAEYLAAEPPGAPSACIDHGELLSHRESIELFSALGVGMAPELKSLPDETVGGGAPSPELLGLADQLISDYRVASVNPGEVWLQSFDPAVIRHWLATAPDFADRVVWLDGRYALDGFDHRSTEAHGVFRDLREAGLRNIAPPVWMLVEAGQEGPVPSAYARAAQEAGLELITWTLERSGSLATGGGWYYQTLNGMNPAKTAGPYRVRDDADQLRLLALLFDELEVQGVFTDWAETTALVDRCAGDMP